MGTNRYKYFTQDSFTGGIEQREGFAKPNQLKDARNVWVKSGSDILETRPGYEYVTGLLAKDGDYGSASITIVAENPLGTFTTTNDLSLLPASGRIYVGIFPSSSYQPYTQGLGLEVDDPNTTSANYRWEYWNGADWTRLNTVQIVGGSVAGSAYIQPASTLASAFLCSSASQHILCFAPPNDWTRTEVNSVSNRYWLRGSQITNVALSNPAKIRSSFSAPYPDDPPISTAKTLTTYAVAPVPYSHGICYLTLGDFSFDLSDKTILRDMGIALTATLGNTGHKSIDQTASNSRYVSVGESIHQDSGGLIDYFYGLFAAEPPTIAYIPQVDEIFLGYRSKVYNVSPTRLKPVSTLLADDGTYVATNFGVIRNYFDAKVENDPVYVADPLSPLYKGNVPQLDVFPAASTIAYHDNVLWATRIAGEDGVVRWSAPAVAGVYLGYRVWPKESFAVLPTDERVTGGIPLHENFIVTTERSVFAMVKVGTDNNNFTTYAPVRVADVGCLSQSSMVNIPGRAIWLANEGIFMFDGTPNFKMISDPINEVMSRVNLSKAQYTVGVHWDFYNMYALAVPLDGSDKNNALLLYDYERNAWWVWDDVSARSLYVLNNELHFMDYYGNVFKFSGVKHDNGSAIDAYATTHRMGKEDRTSKTARDVRVTAYGQEVTVALLAGDREQAASAISFGSTDDAAFDSAVFDSATWPDEEIKERRIGVRQAGRWFQLKVASSSKTTPLRLNNLAIGYIEEGRR